MTAYQRLKNRFHRIAVIGEAEAMLDWDAAAVMHAGGGPARGEQLAVLAGLAHGLLVEEAVAEDLAAADAAPPDEAWDRANLALMQHRHRRAVALPGDLVEASVRARSQCEKVWRSARADSDFRRVAPHLTEVVHLARQSAVALGEALGLDPYDALMDGYQNGVGAAQADQIFELYGGFLQDALPQAEARQAAQPAPLPLTGHFPADRQEALCRELAVAMGLDFEHARLDRSAHPFCGGTPTDVRITTRYDETDPSKALFGVLHETGHALYERGLPEAFACQPVGEASGMAVHESQSLLIEMQVCRSDAYLAWLGPKLAGCFPGIDSSACAPGNLSRLWRRVERGHIRVDADELTYPAHIILRFRLEKALISGELQIADLPSAWNDESRALLGIVPPDDARGCLQDIHWYDGSFGYFPSYTLGAMAAAQLMASARRALPDLDALIAQGNAEPLLTWLRSNVHRWGRRHGLNGLLMQATGRPLEPADFLHHLTSRYLSQS